METVALLKQENRKLAKQVKDAAGNHDGAGSDKVGRKGSSREMAQLNVENEMLTAQVKDLTTQLEN